MWMLAAAVIRWFDLKDYMYRSKRWTKSETNDEIKEKETTAAKEKTKEKPELWINMNEIMSYIIVGVIIWTLIWLKFFK